MVRCWYVPRWDFDRWFGRALRVGGERGKCVCLNNDFVLVTGVV